MSRSPSWQAESSKLKMLVIETTNSTFSMGHVGVHACVCALACVMLIYVNTQVAFVFFAGQRDNLLCNKVDTFPLMGSGS